MKPGQIFPRSLDAFQKWSDEHRAQIWEMIERLGKGEITHKEARNLLREEKKALNAISKQVFGFRTIRGHQPKTASSTSIDLKPASFTKRKL